MTRRGFLARLAAGLTLLQRTVTGRLVAPAIDIPVGYVVEVAHGTPPPPGWLPCDGRGISPRAYPALAAVLGTAYGSGSACVLPVFPHGIIKT